MMIIIYQSPAELADSIIPGHREGDLIIGKEYKSSIVILVKRTTRYLIITSLKVKDVESVRKAVANNAVLVGCAN